MLFSAYRDFIEEILCADNALMMSKTSQCTLETEGQGLGNVKAETVLPIWCCTCPSQPEFGMVKWVGRSTI